MLVRLAALASLCAAPLPAQVAPIDQPFTITTEEGLHSSPVLAARPDGTYLIVWQNTLSPHIALSGRFFGPGGAPLAPPFDIESSRVNSPAVAILPDGGFVAVWERTHEIFGSVHDRDGKVRIPKFQMAPRTSGNPTVAAGADGSWMVAWEGTTPWPGWTVFAQWFAPDGTPRKPPLYLSRIQLEEQDPRIAALPNGGFLALWSDWASFDLEGNTFYALLSRRFDGEGASTAPEALVTYDAIPGSSRLFPLSGGAQGFVVAREDENGKQHFLLLDAEGEMSDQRPVTTSELGLRVELPPVADAAGRLLLTGTFQGLQGLFCDAADLTPMGARFAIPTALPASSEPALASARPGQLLMAWEDGERLFGEIHTIGCENPGLGLCLAQGRFRVEVSWHDGEQNGDQNGEQNGQGDHPARAVPLRDDTGAFWFFSPSNTELLVKILDGRGINGHFWVFYGSLSDVSYDIRVTDTQTGDVRVYTNPAGTLASHADTEAFPPPAGAAAAPVVAAIPAGSVHRTAAPSTFTSTDCHSSDTALCLSSGYQVRVNFVDPGTGEKRQARTAPFSAESGAFWFFGEANLELFVKVLDGTTVNGHIWVFHGALSDVEYTLTVRAPNGEEWSYHNPRGRMHSGADTSAFPSPGGQP